MNEPIDDERARLTRQAAGLMLLVILIAILFGVRFTSRTEQDLERTHARVLLRTVYRLEEAFYEEQGAYLPIHRGMNSQVLKLADLRGLQFNVVVAESSFVAFVEVRPGTGAELETWRVDSRNPEPELVTR